MANTAILLEHGISTQNVRNNVDRSHNNELKRKVSVTDMRAYGSAELSVLNKLSECTLSTASRNVEHNFALVSLDKRCYNSVKPINKDETCELDLMKDGWSHEQLARYFTEKLESVAERYYQSSKQCQTVSFGAFVDSSSSSRESMYGIGIPSIPAATRVNPNFKFLSSRLVERDTPEKTQKIGTVEDLKFYIRRH